VHELRATSAGSVLGLAWAVVQPLLLLVTYWFLLTVLRAKHLGPGGAEQQALVLMSGLVPWLFVSRAVAASLGMLTGHAGLIKHVNFPVGVLPFVSVGVQGVSFVVGLGSLLLVAALAGALSWNLLLLVPTSLLLAAFLVGVAALLGPLAVMLRDLSHLMQFALRVGLFFTPVLYLPAALPDRLHLVAELNPVAYFVALVRYATTGLPEALLFDLRTDAAVATGMTVAVALAAWRFGAHARRRVVDHL
jgi:ABC-type polysaccharide/polyol phosphate export permease